MTHVIRAVVKYVRRNPGVAVLVVVALVAFVLAMREPGGTETFRGELSDTDMYNAVRGYCKKKGRTISKAISTYRKRWDGEYSDTDIDRACRAGIALRKADNNFGQNDIAGLTNGQYKRIVADCRDNELETPEAKARIIAKYKQEDSQLSEAAVKQACERGFKIGSQMAEDRTWSREDYQNKCGGNDRNTGKRCPWASLRRNYPCETTRTSEAGQGGCCETDGVSCKYRTQDRGSTYVEDEIKRKIEAGEWVPNTEPRSSGNPGKPLTGVDKCRYYARSQVQWNGKTYYRCDYNRGFKNVDAWWSHVKSGSPFWAYQCVKADQQNCIDAIEKAITSNDTAKAQ